MDTISPLHQFLLQRILRTLRACFGLFVCSCGAYLQMQANIGLSPWNAMQQALSNRLPISYGTATIAVSIVVLIAALLMHERFGIGTLLEAFLVGCFMDLFLGLGLVPTQTSLPIQLPMMLTGLVIVSFGQYFYMTAALSCGSKDAMLVGIGKRLPRISIGTINTVLYVLLVLLTLLMGGKVGIGTLVNVAFSGASMDMVFRLFHNEPRAVVHEGLGQTLDTFASLCHFHRPHLHLPHFSHPHH